VTATPRPGQILSHSPSNPQQLAYVWQASQTMHPGRLGGSMHKYLTVLKNDP
jgi:hypothetical protein